MKAAVTLITIVIIVAIVVAIGLMLWLYLSGFFTEVSEAGEVRTERSLEVLSSCIKIEEAFQNKFFIRNCGNGLITNDTLDVYLDNELIDFDLEPSSIDGGKTGTINLKGVWGISIGQHSLRIINPNTEALTYFESELSDSAVLALDFEEGSGTIVYDKSEYGNDGTLYNDTIECSNGNCPTWVSGKFGKAIEFDGINDYVLVESDPSLNPIGGVTVSAWVKSKGSSIWQYMIDKRTSDNSGSYILAWRSSPNRFYLGVFNSTDNKINFDSLISPNFNQWYHLLGFYNGTNCIIFVNGISDNTAICNSGTHSSIADVAIGSRYTKDEIFNGTIDSVRIYNKALTPDETLKFRII